MAGARAGKAARLALLLAALAAAAWSHHNNNSLLLPGVAAAQEWATYTTTAGVKPGAAGALSSSATLALAREAEPQYGESFPQLDVDVTPETPSRLRVRIAPSGVARHEVPAEIVQRLGPQPGLAASQLLYDVAGPTTTGGGAQQPWALTVTRRSTGEKVFDTSGRRFLFKDQYIELTTAVPADTDLYGIGEVSLPTGMLLPRDGSIVTLWARDLPSANPYVNLYGAHPFYLAVGKDGNAHGVLLLNSNGMDVVLERDALQYRAIGGLVDLYFFLGPTPEEVVKQYHQFLGQPAMPPYWSLGLHQAHWGYKDADTLEQVVANYSASGVPLETVWSDIEYMPKFWTMEFDPVRYPVKQMRAFVDRLHANGQHWIPIHDAGVAVAEGYKAYEDGVAADIFVKDHTGKKDYLAQVWPGTTVFPDYLYHPSTAEWLTTELTRWHSEVPFDGLWLDMNEPASFCAGVACEPDTSNKTAMHWLTVEPPLDFDITELIPLRTTCQMKCEMAALSNTLDNPPYRIHNWLGPQDNNADIAEKTMSLTALRHGGVREYDTHNLYGASMAHDHYHAVKAVTGGKRPFLLSRSTFPGSGRFTAHWTGDNGANWANLYYSIAGIVNTNLWGIPMAGADICGFFDVDDGHSTDDLVRSSSDAYEQLCERWASAGAFYPFSRNHYTYFARPHEYYQWPSVAAAAKRAYGLRYQLLTYLYSSLYLAHASGGAVAQPLLFADPRDAGARNASAQWLLGDAVLVSPVVTPDTTTIQAHFTKGAWYSAWNYSRLLVPAGGPLPLDVPRGDIAVHYRGGSIVPVQRYANVTRDIRYSPVTLVVALPAEPAGAAGAALPPYNTEPVCAEARAKNPTKLVSCGLVFMDSERDVDLGPDNSLEVWFVSVTSRDGRSGRLTATVKTAGAEVAGKLLLAGVHVVGADPEGAAAAAAAAASEADVYDVVGTAFADSVDAPNGRVVYDADAFDVMNLAFSEAAALQRAERAPRVTVNGQPLAALAAAAAAAKPAARPAARHYPSAGVVQLSDLGLPLGEPLDINWSL